MPRIRQSGLIFTVLCASTLVAQGVALTGSEAPQTGLELFGTQWIYSGNLAPVVDFLKKGDRPQAKAKLAEFLKAYPKDPRGPELAGMILMEEKNYQVAALSFQRALSLKPNNPQALAKLGVSLLLQDKKKEGEERLNQAIAIRPGEPLARRYLGWLEEGRGNLNAAGAHYAAALNGGEIPSGTVTDFHTALARIYGSFGRNEQVVQLLAPVISKGDSSVTAQAARFQLAFAYVSLNRPEADPLLHSLEKVLKPDNPELRYLKAVVQLESNPSSARGKLQELLKAQPSYAGRARFQIARSYALEGKPELAAKELESLAEQAVKGDLPQIMNAMATIYVASGKPAEAVTALEPYVKKYPEIAEIPYLQAEARFQAGDLANAQTQLKQLTTTQPDYARPYALLGQIERTRNSLSLAEEYLRKAVSLDRTLAAAWVNLAAVYASRKEFRKAESALKDGLAANPDNPFLNYELANVYTDTGRGKEANPVLKSIVSRSPSYVPALNSLALNLAESSDLADARKYAEQAYKIDPRDPKTQDAYGWVLVLSNDVSKGLPLLEQAATASPNDPAVSYHLGAALLKAGKTEEGKRHLQRSLTSGPPEYLKVKAQSLLK